MTVSLTRKVKRHGRRSSASTLAWLQAQASHQNVTTGVPVTKTAADREAMCKRMHERLGIVRQDP